MKQPLHISGVKDYAQLKFKFSEAGKKRLRKMKAKKKYADRFVGKNPLITLRLEESQILMPKTISIIIPTKNNGDINHRERSFYRMKD